MFFGERFAIAILFLSTLFGAAAAIQLPSLGGSSIQPSHLLLFSLIVCCLLRPRLIQASLASAAFPGPGFWFAGYVFFSVLSAFFLPRIFQGATLVYSSARGTSGTMSTIASPLSPGSSNLTQSVYLLSGLACFAIVLCPRATGTSALPGASIGDNCRWRLFCSGDPRRGDVLGWSP